eukprot:c8818_g1_i1.p1 GENE.c8818_g1_i1~~c8818_g1_i1.p1  ORF type:complete len:494 (+),score=69.69 c8818_g1_i1:39-1484(+)
MRSGWGTRNLDNFANTEATMFTSNHSEFTPISDECCHPSQPGFRCLVLFLTAMITFGPYFALDSIGSAAPFLKSELHIGEEGIGQLYSIYSFPNIIMVFFAGVFTDRVGTNKASLLFASLVVLGAAIVAPAWSLSSMLLGRFLFGIGSESLGVCQSAILSRWFANSVELPTLAMSYGVAITFSRLGTVCAFNLVPEVASAMGLRAALYLAAILCCASLGFCIALVVLDRHAAPLLSLDPLRSVAGGCWGDTRSFPGAFWLMVVICVTFSCSIFPFLDFATPLIYEKWNLSAVEAGRTVSIVTLASVVLSPIFGWMMDRYGCRPLTMALGGFILAPAFALMATTQVSPLALCMMVGVGFALVPSALWASIPLIVKENMVGTAFGMMSALQNFGLFMMPLIVGQLRQTSGSYTTACMIFATLSAVSCVSALVLIRVDSQGMQSVLGLPSGAVRCYSHPPDDDDDDEALLRPRDFSGRGERDWN